MNTNPNLPANAIAVPAVRVGMTVRARFSGERGTVLSISSAPMGKVKFVLDSGQTIIANPAGTLRLV